MIDGVRLQMMLIRGSVPEPAPFEVVNALAELEIVNGGEGQDAFQIQFHVGRIGTDDFQLVVSDALAIDTRIHLTVLVGVRPVALMDGVITQHQLEPGRNPGQSTFVVTGLDVSQLLDRQDKNESHPNQSDSSIVVKLLKAEHFVPVVTPTSGVPTQLQRIPSQHETSLKYIQRLAQKHSFAFYVEPTVLPGVTKAFWGKETRDGIPQDSLNVNMGSFTNVDQIHFGFDGLTAKSPVVTVIEPFSKTPLQLPIPNLLNPNLSSRPAAALQTEVVRDSSGMDSTEAVLRGLQLASAGADSATVRGTLDAVRYGSVLRARRPVTVRGAGRTNDGDYYVKRVKHRIRRGQYKQDFQLTRDGQGAMSTRIGS